MMENTRKKFIFNCQRCGLCCEQKGDFPVYFSDIERWSKDGVIYRVFHDLRVSEDQGVVSIYMETENGKCKMYDTEKKECSIYDSRPVTCRAYPLRFDGNGFLVRDENCPGLYKGEMTKEALEEIRNAAMKEHEEEGRNQAVLPIVHAILLKDIVSKSEKEFEKLSEEEKEKLKEILKRSQD